MKQTGLLPGKTLINKKGAGTHAKDISVQKIYWLKRVDFNILTKFSDFPRAGRYDTH